MEEFFFEETKHALKNITSMYDAIWPMAVGLWNLRYMSIGIKAECPEIANREISNRFCMGSGIKPINLRTSFFNRSWEEQRSDFAWLLLNNVIPIYEDWLSEMKKLMGIDQKERIFEFPDKIIKNLSRILKDKSDVMEQCLYPAYKKKKEKTKEYSYNELENLMRCYRVFKEMRNCYMHQGANASDNLLKAYEAYKPYSGAKDINMKEELEIPPITAGTPIVPSLRGVVGFSAVLIRILVTLDTKLICSKQAEEIFYKRFKEKHTTLPSLNPRRDRALAQVAKYVRQCVLITPENPELMMDYLLKKGLVSR